MTVETLPSVPEVLRLHLIRQMGSAIPGGIYVGPTPETAQELGCVSILNAGGVGVEQSHGAPWIRRRLSVRCIAPTIELAEQLGRVTEATINATKRVHIDDSNGDTQYIESAMVTGGPSSNRDSDAFWSEILFAEVMLRK